MTEVQGSSSRSGSWSPPAGTLGELVVAAERRAATAGPLTRALEAEAAARGPVPPFAQALRTGHVTVVAEIKRRSPSKGVLNDRLDVASRATQYTEAGAAALSVLTEPERFGGSLDDLRLAADHTGLPLLRKDFVVDRVQLLEARAAGASAVLLIARALAPARFASLARDATALGLELLLEVRDEDELERALRVHDAVIGVNNRNLETLEVDDAVTARLVPRIPRDRVVVYESGVSNRSDVERAASLGADAVLVGSALSRFADGRAAVEALVGVPRSSDGR